LSAEITEFNKKLVRGKDVNDFISYAIHLYDI